MSAIDVMLIIFLVLLGLFMLFKIYLLVKTEYLDKRSGKAVSSKKIETKKPPKASEDLLIIIDLDEEEI